MRTTIIIYGILIGVLTGYWYYLCQDCRNSEQIVHRLGETLMTNNRILERFADQCHGELYMMNKKLRVLEDTTYLAQAEKIKSLTQGANSSSKDSLVLLYTALHRETQALFKNDQQIADSKVTESLRTATKAKYHEYIAGCLRSQIYLLESRAVQQLRDSAHIKEAQLWDYIPIVLPSRDCLNPADTCVVNVYGCAYLCQSENLKMYINGQPIPVERGIGQWTTTFNKPGEVNIEAKILRKNPFTGYTDSYQRTFTQSICPNKSK
jgi:hypothetical protein